MLNIIIRYLFIVNDFIVFPSTSEALEAVSRLLN